ncbi:DUF368 domain-containing protein [Streptomyces monticola]|uniref:DUF368 domain-containing protein n=1 Tax=Streptomyces monticola TaxID=2666263 RepID=A0ABW2JR43_9ACTN
MPKQHCRSRLLDVLRGCLIGSAEVVPGVSGGTVALVTGVYEQLIGAIGQLAGAARCLVVDLPRGRGTARAGRALRDIDWGLLVPVLAGMAAALVLGARLIAPFVESHPQSARALFFGLVLASLWVPYTQSGRAWRVRDFGLAAAVGAGAFVLTGLPPAQAPTHPAVVFAAGAVAICALVLPGLSGSFILLTIGLYEPTIAAVNERDFGHLAAFGAGCVVGLGLFAKALKWLLQHRRHVTLVVMTGLMAGSLRALWPWQDADRRLLTPDGSPTAEVLLALAGCALVVGVLLIEARVRARGGRASVAAGGAAAGMGQPVAARSATTAAVTEAAVVRQTAGVTEAADARKTAGVSAAAGKGGDPVH